ncbi:Mdg1p NDAI_0F03310 [Naumovozyma dairenensis CBS 421]|uniref:AMP-activated protein kinase glycogen-binding domain-containing protein n=1 Tax=Naumovozyma dairenensis (strain ATCC 10597 / BCRC 20456 / CBS 421 / NBRC 0211 / NRRL Y-12639) TaxID=1071378 RepID=G0WCY8_NAUDC|nr:hypothetical protein NDAI_0F03310 [Naumovozyma dairenensis CBS 421]CCD25649.1 hypothetical protein NDAI_0F03310 [Naumovozyma dairenensis CBS 421]
MSSIIIEFPFVWSEGHPKEVTVTGPFDDWKGSIHMIKDELTGSFSAEFPIEIDGRDGTFIFKFIVDGHWLINPVYKSIYDDNGNQNNYISIEDVENYIQNEDPAVEVDVIGPNEEEELKIIGRKMDRLNDDVQVVEETIISADKVTGGSNFNISGQDESQKVLEEEVGKQEKVQNEISVENAEIVNEIEDIEPTTINELAIKPLDKPDLKNDVIQESDGKDTLTPKEIPVLSQKSQEKTEKADSKAPGRKKFKVRKTFRKNRITGERVVVSQEIIEIKDDEDLTDDGSLIEEIPHHSKEASPYLQPPVNNIDDVTEDVKKAEVKEPVPQIKEGAERELKNNDKPIIGNDDIAIASQEAVENDNTSEISPAEGLDEKKDGSHKTKNTETDEKQPTKRTSISEKPEAKDIAFKPVKDTKTKSSKKLSISNAVNKPIDKVHSSSQTNSKTTKKGMFGKLKKIIP